MWEDAQEWIHRNEIIHVPTVYNAMRLPQTFEEFSANPLFLLFIYKPNEERIFKRWDLLWAKRLAEGSYIDINPVSIFPPGFANFWLEEEKRMKEKIGEDCKGIGGYVVGVVTEGKDDLDFLPVTFAARRSEFDMIVKVSDWETRLLNHTYCMKTYTGRE